MTNALFAVEEFDADEELNVDDDVGDSNVIHLSDFVADFGQSLLSSVSEQNPPLYLADDACPMRDLVMSGLKRQPFPAQRDAVQAVSKLLIDADEKAAIINAEMGTGKTMMAICTAAIMHAEGFQRSLVLSPPHLVYKWRREILETVPGARVWILNGPDTLRKLLLLRQALGLDQQSDTPEFYIMGRVRMRMGFHWKPAYHKRKLAVRQPVVTNDEYCEQTQVVVREWVACSHCFALFKDSDGNAVAPHSFDEERRHYCNECGSALWTLMRSGCNKTPETIVRDALCQLPTIGAKTAEKLIKLFGEKTLMGMLADNIYEFVNLMDAEGDLFFSDRQAQRMERALSKTEFSFGQGGYQPTEFVKRYLPNHFFDICIVDEGHEYKNSDSAQGQAMGVLANKVRKVILLTGTLMGGYAEDLFYLLWRIMPQRMIEDGYRYNSNGTLGSASLAFMRRHGILKDIYKETEGGNHKTARGKRVTVHTVKAPGFGPKGITHYVLPFTVFLKLKQIGENVLPTYEEFYREIPMSNEMQDCYTNLAQTLTAELKQALRKGDKSLLGVVLNVLLAWPDCAFRDETVKHPRSRNMLAYVPSVLDEAEPSPKEEELIQLCKDAKSRNRRVLVYTVYTGTRDTASRLSALLKQEGLKVAVMRSTVPTDQREDWIADQVDRGIDVLICNPDLVKTGLDLLEFPSIVFMQSGYNVYTVLQAARRSWRIGQRVGCEVYFLGYADSAQIACLRLMAQKIAVAQSTSGDMPETGLDSLNQGSDSIEVELARQLLAA